MGRKGGWRRVIQGMGKMEEECGDGAGIDLGLVTSEVEGMGDDGHCLSQLDYGIPASAYPRACRGWDSALDTTPFETLLTDVLSSEPMLSPH